MEANGVAARAALDAARAVFDSMISPAAPTGAAGSDDATAARAAAAWRATEGVLRAVTGRPDLGGQALVGEARRTDRLTLGDAHVLVALHGLMERSQNPTAGGVSAETARSTAREAMLALEHAVAAVQREERAHDPGAPARASSFAPGTPVTPSPYAPPGVAGVAGASRDEASRQRDYSADGARERMSDRMRDPAWSTSDTAPPTYAETPTNSRRRMVPLLVAVLLVVGLAAGGTWLFLRGRGGGAYDEAVAAYQRGARESARLAFARAAQDSPDDPRPLIYLGRMSREEGDFARAQRFLDRAIRLAPNSGIAQREMASTLLAQGNLEVASRFYVRAIQIDNTDRLAQGFLACTMHKLGRFDEARRWFDRAGAGEWSPCLATPVTPVPGGMPGAMQGSAAGALPPPTR